jgi:hypothetical protein
MQDGLRIACTLTRIHTPTLTCGRVQGCKRWVKEWVKEWVQEVGGWEDKGGVWF